MNQKYFESKLIRHILNEKYLGEDAESKMTSEEKRAFLKSVANYHRLGEMVYRADSLREVAKTLGGIVEQAEKLTLSESEHWFDNVTVSRHMKQMNEAYKVFEKTAAEMSGMQQRLESAYEDMGTILNRYYKVNEALSEDEYTAGVDDLGPALEEDQYTAGVSDYGPAFHDHMTATNSKRLKESKKKVNEASVTDPKLKKLLADYYEKQKEFDQLNSKIKQLKKEMDDLGLDEALTPLLDSMKEIDDRLATADEYIVKIMRFGYDSSSARYKEAFELAITKVNDATANVLNNALETTKKVSKVKHSFNIEKLTEASFLSKLKNVFKSIFNKAAKAIKAESDDLNVINKEFAAILKAQPTSLKFKPSSID
jgi:hypothetical protein